MHRLPWLLAAILLLGLWAWSQRSDNGDLDAPIPSSAVSETGTGRGYPDFLPPEAHGVLDRIARGGPFAHRQDGSVFQNRERRLPPQPRGWYHEYTVPTPGADDRGARRIITGGDPPSEYWYTDDHYRSFRRFDLAPEPAR